MPRPSSDILTPREAEIMGCLWRAGSATADQIREQLEGEPHDSSVRTLLRVLEEKGFVGHSLEGKAYVDVPRVAQSSAQSQATNTLLKRLFGGSAATLVLKLLEDEEISPEELRKLAERVQANSSSPGKKQSRSRKKP